MVEDGEKIAIGLILRPHGIRGFARVLPLTDDIRRYSRLDMVWLQKPPAEPLQAEIEAVNYQDRFVLLKLKNFDTREAIEGFRGWEIAIERRECLPLEEDAYYIFDLIGMQVMTVAGEFIGIVSDVLDYPASHVFVIRNGDQEILIPAVEQFIKQINLEQSRITIEPIEGLLP